MRLDLSQHCIETEIRRLYNKRVTQCLKSKQDDHHLEAMVELLKSALETFDFSLLRSRYPILSGHNEVIVFLAVDSNDDMRIMVDKEVIQI